MYNVIDILSIASHVKDSAELKAHKTKLQHYVDHTASAMKKNVYRNYNQFIYANKEIQNLEAEVYDLKSFLNEEKQILTDLKAISMGDKLFVDSTKEKALSETNKEMVNELRMCVEALEENMVMSLDRYLVSAADLIELDQDSYTFLRIVKFCLFSDAIILCERVEQSAEAMSIGRKPYFFLTFVELSRAAVVDIKDTAEVRNAFKLFVGKDCIVYECETLSKKEKLLELILSTEEKRKNVMKNKRADARRTKVCRKSLVEKKKMIQKNSSILTELKHNKSLPDWVANMADDLDVYIAERDFEKATELIERANKFLEHQDIAEDYKTMDSLQKELKIRKSLLSEILINDLRSPSLKLVCLHRSVSLLTRLGFRERAREMFLQSRSRLFRHAFRSLKIEGATDLYINKLSRVFFTGLRNTVQEFNISFSDPFSRSDFVCWAVREVEIYGDIFARQVFHVHNFNSIADCLIIMFSYSKILLEVGLDMNNVARCQLKDQIIESINASSVSALKHLSSFIEAETWDPAPLPNKRASCKYLPVCLMTSYVCAYLV